MKDPQVDVEIYNIKERIDKLEYNMNLVLEMMDGQRGALDALKKMITGVFEMVQDLKKKL